MSRRASDAAERTLPHSLEAERSVLGAILVDPKAWAVASSILVEADFYRDAHQRIFKALRGIAERGQPADFVLLNDALSVVGDLDECGGAVYVASLANDAVRSANVEYYARIVRERARLRSLIYAANQLADGAYDNLDSAVVAEAAVKEIAKTVDVGATVTDGDALVQAFVDTALSDDAPSPALRTGYTDLDAQTGGLRLGDLVVVAARPSVGKTAFTLGAAEHIAAGGHVVPFFSLEMSRHGIGGRLLALRSGVPVSLIESRALSQSHYARIAAAREKTGRPLYPVFDCRTTLQVEAWCRRLKQQGGLACAVVDYMQMLAVDEEESSVAAVSRSLKRLAHELNIVMIGISQLSRAPEGRRDKRPQPSDLRGSGAIEQDADTVILLYREELHAPSDENRGIAEAIVAKQRNGPQGVVKLVFLSELAKFCDLARVYDGG